MPVFLYDNAETLLTDKFDELEQEAAACASGYVKALLCALRLNGIEVTLLEAGLGTPDLPMSARWTFLSPAGQRIEFTLGGYVEMEVRSVTAQEGLRLDGTARKWRVDLNTEQAYQMLIQHLFKEPANAPVR